MKEISSLIEKILTVVKDNKEANILYNSTANNINYWITTLHDAVTRKYVENQTNQAKYIDFTTFNVLKTITELYPNNEVSTIFKTFLEKSYTIPGSRYYTLVPTEMDLPFLVLAFGLSKNKAIIVKYILYDEIKEYLIKLYEYIAEDKHKKLNYKEFLKQFIDVIAIINGCSYSLNNCKECKPGKFLTKLFPNVKASEIGNFVDYITALTIQPETETNLEFNIIKGLDICYYYNENNYVKRDKNTNLLIFENNKVQESEPDTLNKSCMRYNEKGIDIEFYSKFPEKISLGILTENNKLRARCILWTADDGNKYYDRVYYFKTSDYDLLVNRLIKEGYRNCSCSNREKYDFPVEITISKSKYETVTKCPYLDTLCYFIVEKDTDNLIIMNNDAVELRQKTSSDLNLHSVGKTLNLDTKTYSKIKAYKKIYNLIKNINPRIKIGTTNTSLENLVYNTTTNQLDLIENCTYNNYIEGYISKNMNPKVHILIPEYKLKKDIYYLCKLYEGKGFRDYLSPVRLNNYTKLVYSSLYGYKIFNAQAYFNKDLNSYIFSSNTKHLETLKKLKINNV